MAVIWGAYLCATDSKNYRYDCDDMLNELQSGRIDRFDTDTYRDDKKHMAVISGCGHQYYTKEAVREILPVQNNMYIWNADAVVDNRDEFRGHMKKTDSEILFDTYINEGDNTGNIVLGCYSFAVYNKVKSELTLMTDSMGQRSLYYYVSDNAVYYSTLLTPLINVLKARGISISINDCWIETFLGLNQLGINADSYSTCYENIYIVPPATRVRIAMRYNRLVVESKRYWHPEVTVQKLDLKSDEDYKHMFRYTYSTAVEAVLRSRLNTGILLSGGLDSTSVAAWAVQSLSKNNKELYAYTSVPEKNYVSEFSPYYIVDESRYALISCNYYRWMKPHIIRLEGKNCYDAMDELLEEYEMPCKSLQNMMWISESLNRAYNDNCRIMLTGQYGNTTVSYGEYDILLSTLSHNRQFLRLAEEINSLHKSSNISRKYVFKSIYDEHRSRRIQKDSAKDNILENVYANVWKSEETGATDKIAAIREITDKVGMTFDEYRPFMNYDIALRQIGEMETKSSYKSGVLMRDPTRDRRMVELVMAMPLSQFVRDGEERRLIREYMKDMIPSEILIQTDSHKGRQSADMVNRLRPHWQRIYKSLQELINSPEGKEYLNYRSYREALKAFDKGIRDTDEFEIIKLIYSAMAIKFVQKFNSNSFDTFLEEKAQ